MGLGLKILIFTMILSFTFNVFSTVGVFSCTATEKEFPNAYTDLKDQIFQISITNLAGASLALLGIIMKDSTLIFAGIMATIFNYFLFPQALLNECVSGDWGIVLANILGTMWAFSTLTFLSKSDF